ncbi:NADP-dependent oxidoreductase [Ancylomarina sp. 16SWW S1-10-2]|uniref:NADP-dependent oxidoreductase n=1 Tax=Ancylomarina sp. 16SWW S1-10-2 TaxID=2499681 RepID=UPI0012AE3F08|nr:NADP-dependent oxidoreductase [Ancylomarina sp. 16SWW S1-10-2]MRT92419.1 NADP-dependent oxidoreductase [Ancylomarina sp. 16SWW S1-10-2]
MKAIVLDKAGSSENLMLMDINKPVLKNNEVLVETKAISINPVDYKIRSTEEGLTMMYGATRPVILGWDLAGSVVAVGENVSQFKIGDKVFGMVNFPGAGNAYAEFVAAPENHLAKMPVNTSFEEAAATTLAALTALQVLESRVKKDDRVLIHAGSGGVGHFAIQIAKHLGAYVITTSSAKNRDFVMSLGADEHIDYRTQAFEEVATDIDFILDGMGGDILMKSLKVMREGGSIISLPSSPEIIEEAQKLADKNISVSALLVQSSAKDMNTLKELLETGVIKAHVSKTFPFAEMAKAHLELESGRTVGKVIVKF